MKYFEEVSAVDQNIQNKFILKSFRLNLIFIFCFAFLVTLWDKKIATPNLKKKKLENIKRLERVYVIIIYGMLKGAIFKILFSPFVANKLLLFFFLKIIIF